jgi:hypothetical protein
MNPDLPYDRKTQISAEMSDLRKKPSVQEWNRLGIHLGRHQDSSVTGADYRRADELESDPDVIRYIALGKESQENEGANKI